MFDLDTQSVSQHALPMYQVIQFSSLKDFCLFAYVIMSVVVIEYLDRYDRISPCVPSL
jgi:hypothetical protein